MRDTRALLPCLLLATLIACSSGERPASSDSDAEHGGTLVISMGGEPDFLLPPFVELITGQQVVDVIFDRLAEPGMALNTFGDDGFTPELAERWQWGRDSMSIAFSLNPRARWHDGRPVTSRDVRFTHRLYVDPVTASPVAPILRSIDSVSTPDSLTAVFWFNRRHPEQFFEAAYQMRILPEHLLASINRSQLRSSTFNRQPVGSGPYRFVRWEPGAVVELAADTANYRGRPNIDRLIWSLSPAYQAAFAKVLAGEADFLEFVPPPLIPQVDGKPDLQLRPYSSLDQGYLHFNLRDPASRRRPHPVLADVGVRRALTMGVDRASIVRNILGENGRVALGPFTRAIGAADTTIAQLPYDTTAAKRLLDSLGWRDSNGDGVREKNGRPLRFAVSFPTTSAIRRQTATLLQESFRRLGARVDIDAFDVTQFSERLRNGQFDAAVNAWHLDPSPTGIRQAWGGEAARGSGVNYGGYQSTTFDAYVDSAAHQMDVGKARGYWRKAYETMVTEAPAIFLYETVNHAVVHKRVRTTGMRADAWWSAIQEWSIPASERIARDRVGPAPTSGQ